MFPTAIIAFREFLEAFLLIGIFFGMDKKMKLGKRKEILLASLAGICISLLLPVTVFFFAQNVTQILTEKNADIVEGYLLTFSGFLLAYVVFSLHNVMQFGKKKTINSATQKLEQEIFDTSLFFTIVFFIAREGFEVALLITTMSVFSTFWINITGLIIGFVLAGCVGLITSLTYIRFPMKKVFLYSEYFIIVLGAAMVKNGISLLFENYLHINLHSFISLPFSFLPSEDTVIGHALNNLVGLEPHLSVLQICIMGMYVAIVWFVFKAEWLSSKFNRNK